MQYYDILEHVEFINENGKALDEFWNEFRDEDGQVVYIQNELRHLFKIVEGV